MTVATKVKSVSFELFAGEITALAGLVGAGRSELALALFGALQAASGSVTLDGVEHTFMTPAKAISLGIGLVTEDRKTQGLAMQMDITANLTAPRLGDFTHCGLVDQTAEIAVARAAIQKFHLACRGPKTLVVTLSGGNQQKLLVARWAEIARRVLIVDEPTRGVDVGARQEIYRLMQELADSGTAVLMISSDLPEVVGMADRVIVMREGTIAGELVGDDISEDRVMRLSAHTGQWAAKNSSVQKNSEEDFAQTPDTVA